MAGETNPAAALPPAPVAPAQCGDIQPLTRDVARNTINKAAGADGEVTLEEFKSAYTPFPEAKQRRLLEAALCDPELRAQIRFAPDARAAAAEILGTDAAAFGLTEAPATPPSLSPSPGSGATLVSRLQTAARKLADASGNAFEARKVFFPSLEEMARMKQDINALTPGEREEIRSLLSQALQQNLEKDQPLRGAVTLQCLGLLGGTSFAEVAQAFATFSRSTCGLCRGETASAICLFAKTDPTAVSQFLDEWMGRESNQNILSQLRERSDCLVR